MLYARVKAGEQRNVILDMFKHVATATQGAAQSAMVPKAMVDKAEKAEPGLIETLGVVDASGNVQVRATAKGLSEFAALSAPTAAAPTPAVKPTFEIESGDAAPEPKRGGIREATYPFDKLELKQSFFIAATEANPNPAKSMGSTISSANKRFAATYPATKGKDAAGNKLAHPKAGQPTGKDGRKFTVRPRTTADMFNGKPEKSNGARIWRIA